MKKYLIVLVVAAVAFTAYGQSVDTVGNTNQNHLTLRPNSRIGEFDQPDGTNSPAVIDQPGPAGPQGLPGSPGSPGQSGQRGPRGYSGTRTVYYRPTGLAALTGRVNRLNQKVDGIRGVVRSIRHDTYANGNAIAAVALGESEPAGSVRPSVTNQGGSAVDWWMIALFIGLAIFVGWLVTFLIRGALPMWMRTGAWKPGDEPKCVLKEMSAHGDSREITPVEVAIKQAEANIKIAQARMHGDSARAQARATERQMIAMQLAAGGTTFQPVFIPAPQQQPAQPAAAGGV